jgi:hypothetical protein
LIFYSPAHFFVFCSDAFLSLERYSEQPLAGSLALAHSGKFLSYFFNTHSLHLPSILLGHSIGKDPAEIYLLGA